MRGLVVACTAMAMALSACDRAAEQGYVDISRQSAPADTMVIPQPRHIEFTGRSLVLPRDASIVVESAATDAAQLLDWFLVHGNREFAAQFEMAEPADDPSIVIAIGDGHLPA